MKTFGTVALLQLCFSAAAAALPNGSFTETTLTAAPGDVALLPCYNLGNVTPTLTTWTKNGREVGGGAESPPQAGQRFEVLRDGSLNIRTVAPGNEGTYLCNSSLPGNKTFQARVLLQVTRGPDNVSTSIYPVTSLFNGTLMAIRGSAVSFNCSGASYPSQQLTWAFRGASSSNDSLASNSGSWLGFRIERIEPSDEGVYSCTVNNTASHQAVSKDSRLLVYYVPDRRPDCMCAVAEDFSQVQLNCTWFGAHPTPKLGWEEGQGAKGAHVYTSEVTNGLSVTLQRSELSNGQTLRCTAEHPALAPGKNESCSLTFNVSDRHPGCMWAPAQDPSQVQFNCTWSHVYPTPKLRWEGDRSDLGAPGKAHVYMSKMANTLTVTLNHSQLSNGQTVKCVAEHILLPPGKEKSCSFTLKPPYPQGDPLATAVEATSVTLTCTESMSFPPANTTWRKGLQQEEIVTGSKYVVSVAGSAIKLTILNVSKDDEGVYFCRSENPLIVTELEVILTVKSSSVNSGTIIGIFISVLILGSTIIIAKTLYSNKHQICLGGGFGHTEERGDVLTLVDSDDEQVFNDTVPQLPPLTNGHHTTLVQIHRIPSSDHEEAATGTRPLDDTVETQEPEDLVSF